MKEADRRVYSAELRRRAAELMDQGLGRRILVGKLAVSAHLAHDWILTYKATGLQGLPAMGTTCKTYDDETRLVAVRDFVDAGLSRQETMTRHGIVSACTLKQWARVYRSGGAAALLPKARGRPPGTGKALRALSREEKLETRVRELEAENAYLKDCRP